MSTEKKEPKFVPTWTFTSTIRGQKADPYSVTVFEMTDALLWFHADRQITNGLGRGDYAVVEIVSDHVQPQHYDRYDLPPSNPDIRACVFSKSLHKAHQTRMRELGWEIRVAA